MLSDRANFHEIQYDHKFFNRLVSKETSMENSPSTVYYGGAPVSIPFSWESQPGTPKHTLSVAMFHPLTPPPSYHSKPKPITKKGLKTSTVLDSIFRKLIAPREKNHASSSSSSPSLSCLSSWSLLHDSVSSSSTSFMNRKIFHRGRNYFSSSCSRSPVHNYIDDGDEDVDRLGSSAKTLCFGVKVKLKNRIEFKSSQSMIKMKKALLSFVNHG